MLEPANENEKIVADRLLEFFARKTPWYRTLWNPGLILSLRELLETSEAVSKQILHPKALDPFKSTCFRLLEGEQEIVLGSRF